MNRIAAGLAVILPSICGAQTDEDWLSLFNGVDLGGWTPKIRQYPAGQNFGDTFRVEDGLLTVSYDRYASFDGRFAVPAR